jgi:hypothetical protein
MAHAKSGVFRTQRPSAPRLARARSPQNPCTRPPPARSWRGLRACRNDNRSSSLSQISPSCVFWVSPKPVLAKSSGFVYTAWLNSKRRLRFPAPLLLDQAHEPELPALVLDDQRALAVRELLVVRLADDVRQQPREVAFADQLFLWWWWQATKCKQRASLAAARERRRWARPSRFYPAG